jgi:2-methylfumaryl-CoA hydratase
MNTNPGRVFEGCRRGETIVHAGPPYAVGRREGAFSHAPYPARHALYSTDGFVWSCGPRAAPPDDLIAFHTVLDHEVMGRRYHRQQPLRLDSANDSSKPKVEDAAS